MGIPSLKNRVGMTVTGTPGTGTITLNAAETGYQTFASAYGANANVDILIEEGSAWEIARDCTYTHSGTTVSRGTLEASSTGSALSLTSAAKVYVIHSATRITALESMMDLMDRKFNSGFFVTGDGATEQVLTNSAYTVLHGNTGGALRTTEWDPDGLWTASTGRFTPPAGRWRIHGAAVIVALDTGKKFIVGIIKNGESVPSRMIGRGMSSSSNSYGASGSTVVEANGTDYFQIVVWQDDVGTEKISATYGYNYFSAEYEGPVL